MTELFRNLVRGLATSKNSQQKSAFKENRFIFMSGGPEGPNNQQTEAAAKAAEAENATKEKAEAEKRAAEKAATQEETGQELTKKATKEDVKNAESERDVKKLTENPDFKLSHLNQGDIKKLVELIGRRPNRTSEDTADNLLEAEGNTVNKSILVAELLKYPRLTEADKLFKKLEKSDDGKKVLRFMASSRPKTFQKLLDELDDDNQENARKYLPKETDKPAKDASEAEKAKLAARQKNLEKAGEKAKQVNPERLRQETNIPKEVVDLVMEGEGVYDQEHFEKIFVLFKNQKQYLKHFKTLGITERHHIGAILGIAMKSKNESFQAKEDWYKIYPSDIIRGVTEYAKKHPNVKVKTRNWDFGNLVDLQERLAELDEKLENEKTRNEVTDEELVEWNEKTKIYDALTNICRVLGTEDILRKKVEVKNTNSRKPNSGEVVDKFTTYEKYDTLIAGLKDHQGSVHQENGKEVYLDVDALTQGKFEAAKGTLKEKQVSITVSSATMDALKAVYDGNTQSVEQCMDRVFREQGFTLEELARKGLLAKTEKGLVLTSLPSEIKRAPQSKKERIQGELKNNEVKTMDPKAVTDVLKGPVGEAIKDLLEEFGLDADDFNERSLSRSGRGEKDEVSGTILDQMGSDPDTMLKYLVSELHQVNVKINEKQITPITFNEFGKPELNKEAAKVFINTLIKRGVLAKRLAEARREEQENPIEASGLYRAAPDYEDEDTADYLDRHSEIFDRPEGWTETGGTLILDDLKEKPGWNNVAALLEQQPFNQTEKAQEKLTKILLEEFNRGTRENFTERVFQAFFKEAIQAYDPISENLEGKKITNMDQLIEEFQAVDDRRIDLERKDMREEITEEETKELKEIRKKHSILKHQYIGSTIRLIRTVQKVGIEKLSLAEEEKALQLEDLGSIDKKSAKALVYGLDYQLKRNQEVTKYLHQEFNPEEYETREIPEELLSENKKNAELQKQLFRAGVPIEIVADFDTVFNAQLGAALKNGEFEGAALRVGVHENVGVLLTYEVDAVSGGITLHGEVYNKDGVVVDLGGAVTLGTDLDPRFFFGANTSISMEDLEGQTFDNVDFNAFAGLSGAIFNPAGWMAGVGVGLSYNQERALVNTSLKEFEDYKEVEKATTIEAKVKLLKQNEAFTNMLRDAGIDDINQLGEPGIITIYENYREYLIYSSYQKSAPPFISGVGVGVAVGSSGVYLGLGLTLNLHNKVLRVPYHEAGIQRAESVADTMISKIMTEAEIQAKMNASGTKTFESGDYYTTSAGEIVALEGKVNQLSEPTTNLKQIVDGMKKWDIDARVENLTVGSGADAKEVKVLSFKPLSLKDATTNVYIDGYETLSGPGGRIYVLLPAEGKLNVSAANIRTFDPTTPDGGAQSRSIHISSGNQDKAGMLAAMRESGSIQYVTIDGETRPPIVIAGANEATTPNLVSLETQLRDADTGNYYDVRNPAADEMLSRYEGFQTTVYGIPEEDYQAIEAAGRTAPGLSEDQRQSWLENPEYKAFIDKTIEDFWKQNAQKFRDGSIAPGENVASKEVILDSFLSFHDKSQTKLWKHKSISAAEVRQYIVDSIQDLYYIENKGAASRQLRKFDSWSKGVRPVFEKGFAEAITNGFITPPNKANGQPYSAEEYAETLAKHFMDKLKTGLVGQLSEGRQASIPEDHDTWIKRVATMSNRTQQREVVLAENLGGPDRNGSETFSAEEATKFGYRHWEEIGVIDGSSPLDKDLRTAIKKMSHKEVQTNNMATVESIMESVYDNQIFDQLVKSREFLGLALHETYGIEAADILERVLDYQSKTPEERRTLLNGPSKEFYIQDLKDVGEISNQIRTALLNGQEISVDDKRITLEDGNTLTGDFVEIKVGQVTFYGRTRTAIATYNKCTNPLIANKYELYAHVEGQPAVILGAKEVVTDADSRSSYSHETAEVGVGVAVGFEDQPGKGPKEGAKDRRRPDAPDGKDRGRPRGQQRPRATDIE